MNNGHAKRKGEGKEQRDYSRNIIHENFQKLWKSWTLEFKKLTEQLIISMQKDLHETHYIKSVEH